MTTYDYTWKIGVERFSSRQLTTNKPISERDRFVDVCTGDRYSVLSVFEAGPKDKAWSAMPDTAIQTWPVGQVSEAELNELREKSGYVPTGSCQPLADVVFI